MVNSPGRYNKDKYICTQHQTGEIGSNTIIVDFSTPLSMIDEQTDQ